MTQSLFFNLNKFILLITFLFLFNSTATCQEIYQKTIGTAGDDLGSLFKTKNGYHLVGYSNIKGSNDMYIVQLDDNFEVIWSKIYGTDIGERAFELAQKPNGNLLISGWGNNGSSILLIEIDLQGNLIGAKGQGSLHDRLHKIIKTMDGGYLNYGELEGMVPGHNKASLLKYDAELNIEWKYYYDYSSSKDSDPGFEMYTRQAIQLANSSYIILGSYTDIHNPHYNRKIRIIKTDANGNQKWVKGFHGGRMDNASHIILCEDGGFLISATSNSYSTDNTDILIIKTNENGEQVWLKTYGGKRDEIAGQVLQLPNRKFMVSGSTNSFGAGDYDYLLFEIDENGSFTKAHSYGGEGDDLAIKIDTISNQFILSGHSASFGQGDENIYIVKTAFNNIPIDCGNDISSLMTVKDVSITSYSDQYTQSSFDASVTLNLNTSNIVSEEVEPCFTCPKGRTETMMMCSGENIQIDKAKANPLNVTWQDGANLLSRELIKEGTYWVDIETNQCTYRDSIIVKKETVFNLNLGENKVICIGDTFLLDATIPNALSYTWQDGSSNLFFNASQPGFYKVVVETSCNVISDSIQLSPLEKEEIFIPNVITPNEDEINDYFEIKGTRHNVGLAIYNRWGKEVYQSFSYKNNWNGDDLSSGTYYYLINLGCVNQDYKGWVQIFKN